MSEQRSCSGTNAAGDPCGAPPNVVDPETGRCPAHATEGKERMRELGRKGAEASRAEPEGMPPDTLNPLTCFEDAKARLDLICRAVLEGRIDERAANAAIRAVSEWVKTEGDRLSAQVVEELEERVQIGRAHV